MIEQEPMQVRAEFAERLRVEVPITSDALVRGVSKVAKARFVSPAGIYHCDGARTENNNDLLNDHFPNRAKNAFGGCDGTSTYRARIVGCMVRDIVCRWCDRRALKLMASSSSVGSSVGGSGWRYSAAPATVTFFKVGR
jgi:hypothetical protein